MANLDDVLRQMAATLENVSGVACENRVAINDLNGVTYELKTLQEAVEFVRNDQEKKEKKKKTRYVNSDSEKLMFRYNVAVIYEKYNPTKLSDLERLFRKYAGRERELYEAVACKYQGQDRGFAGGSSVGMQ